MREFVHGWGQAAQPQSADRGQACRRRQREVGRWTGPIGPIRAAGWGEGPQAGVPPPPLGPRGRRTRFRRTGTPGDELLTARALPSLKDTAPAARRLRADRNLTHAQRHQPGGAGSEHAHWRAARVPPPPGPAPPRARALAPRLPWCPAAGRLVAMAGAPARESCRGCTSASCACGDRGAWSEPSLLSRRLSGGSPGRRPLEQWTSAWGSPSGEAAAARDEDRPLVFLCAGCRRPLGDSLSWVAGPEASCILLRSQWRAPGRAGRGGAPGPPGPREPAPGGALPRPVRSRVTGPFRGLPLRRPCVGSGWVGIVVSVRKKNKKQLSSGHFL